MNERDLFLIADTSGFTPQIGRLVSMMNYVRYTTLSAVEGLGVDHVFGHELNHRGRFGGCEAVRPGGYDPRIMNSLYTR